MAGEWPVITLRDALGEKGYIRGPFGSALRRPELKASGVPVYEQQHAISGTREFRFYIDDEKYAALNRFAVKPHDLIISCSGTLARVSMISEEDPVGVISQALLILRPDTTVVWPKYLYYFMSSKRGYDSLVSVSTGSVQVNIAGRSIIEATRLPLPPLPQQRAIAHILGTLDDKIELNRRISETLKAMARALFKSWFADFDPVRAKAEGRDPGLPKPLADLFPARLVDSELGEIPEGWETGTLADLSTLNPEAWTKQTRPPHINYVDLSNTKWGRIEAVTTHAAADAPSRAQRVLRVGDTILGTVRPGNGSFALVSDAGLTGSTGFAVLRPSAPQHAPFVYLAATAAENIASLAHVADGGAYPAVRPEVVAATPVVRPDDRVLERFTLASGALLARIANNDRESRTLASVRDALLPKLISGELRVNDAQRFVESASDG